MDDDDEGKDKMGEERGMCGEDEEEGNAYAAEIVEIAGEIKRVGARGECASEVS